MCVCGDTADVAQCAYINHMVAGKANEDGMSVCVCTGVHVIQRFLLIYEFLQI